MADTDLRGGIEDSEPHIASPAGSSVNEAATLVPQSPFTPSSSQASAKPTTTATSNAQPTGAQAAIEWKDNWNDNYQDHVFTATGRGEAYHTINKLLASKLVLTRGEWTVMRDGDEVLVTDQDLEQNVQPPTVGVRTFQARQDMTPRLDVNANVTVLPLSYLASQPDDYGKDMFLNLTWEYDGQTGWSKSGVFTVAEAGLESLERAAMRSRDPRDFVSKEDLPNAVSSVFGGANVTPTLPSGFRTPGATSNPSATVVSSSDDVDSDESSGGGGGLSIGAKAGIGVGAGLVGLALIGALVWFFCLRNRRKNKDHVSDTPYGADGHASEYMVNKETTAAHVTESPHSPYSDDSLAQQQYQHQAAGHPAHEATSLVGGAAAVATSGHGHDHPSDGQDRGLTEATPLATPIPRSGSQQQQHESTRTGSRSETPQGVNSNVSHLIEDGMTEDEIRRLEDEERQLDAAIEQHGHGRRGA